MSYYRTELEKVDTNSPYSPTIKIKSVNGETKNLSLNDESATILVEWLKENYKIQES